MKNLILTSWHVYFYGEVKSLTMETSKVLKAESKKPKLQASKQTKLIKRFYRQFVDSLSRKTDAEKRVQLYGKDPFK